MDEVIEEIFIVARAHGKPLNRRSADEYKNHFYTKLVPPTARHFPSMYYDVKAGKQLEIDALNGAVVRLAREKGISVPVNETITRITQGKRTAAFPCQRVEFFRCSPPTPVLQMKSDCDNVAALLTLSLPLSVFIRGWLLFDFL